MANDEIGMHALLSPRTAHRASRVLACGLWLAACGLSSCGRPRAEGEPWRHGEFLIGLAEAPPQTAESYAQAAKAGFNVIVAYVGPDALALAQRHGLKLAIGKIGLDPATMASREGQRRAADHIERFGRHPALWGYYLGDRLTDRQLDDYVRLADWLRARDRDRPFYLGLLGCDAWAGPALRTADYGRYLDRVARALHPPLLAFGHHPFRGDGASPFYFENLALVRRAAHEHGLPFAQALRCGQWPGMAALGERELRWLVYTSLVYGARGVVWWGYWRSRDGKGEGIVAADGRPTERWAWVAALNAELRALGPHLMRLRSAAVYHTGADIPPGATRLPPHGLVRSVEGGTFVVGLFQGDEGSWPHVLVANADPRNAADARLAINHPCRAVAWLDPATGRWQNLPVRSDPLETTLEVALPAGGGKLLRLHLAR